MGNKTSFLIALLLLALTAAAETGQKLFLVKRDGKEGFINKEGTLVVPLKNYHWLGREYSEGLVEVRDASGHSYLDESGNVKLSLGRRYDFVYPFKHGLASVEKRGLFGLIDKTGNEVVRLQYKATSVRQSEGRIVINRGLEGKQKRVCDLAGNTIIPEGVYSWILGYQSGVSLVATNTSQLGNSLWGFVNHDGKVIIPLEYELAFLPSEGILFALKENIWRAMDTNGAVLFQGDYKSCGAFHEGVAWVRDRKTDKQGYVDRTGKWVIEPQFEKCAGFSEGIAAFKVDGKWGFMNKAGKTVIEPQFSHAEGYDVLLPMCKGGLIQWREGKKIGYTDRNGKWIWPLSE